MLRMPVSLLRLLFGCEKGRLGGKESLLRTWRVCCRCEIKGEGSDCTVRNTVGVNKDTDLLV